MRYAPLIAALLVALLVGCPETDGADCDVHPERRVCVDACIFEVDQADCVPIVDVCRADPDRDRCDVLLSICDDMPSALGCGGAGSDAGGLDTF